MEFEELRAKTEYAFNRMRVSQQWLVKSRKWLYVPLEEIKMRHEFLCRTGTVPFLHPALGRKRPDEVVFWLKYW